MTSFVLDKHRGLFRDEEACNQFIAEMKSASREDLSVVYAGQEMIGAILSPEGAQSFLVERMLKRFAQKPELWTKSLTGWNTAKLETDRGAPLPSPWEDNQRGRLSHPFL